MPIYEGNTVEEAVDKGLHSLDLTIEDVVVTIQSEAKKGFLGFGKKSAVVSVEPIVSQSASEEIEQAVEEIFVATVPEEIIVEQATVSTKNCLENLSNEEALKELALYLTEITKNLQAPATIRMEKEDNHYLFHLETEKSGRLIGKHGKILNALQYLGQVFIHRVAENKLPIVVNVGDYREKRTIVLERLAQKTANKVKQTGRAIALEPMPAFERKQIHFVLSKDNQIQTYSKGQEPHRYLVVELLDNE